ncbi:uncharacterized protein LOC116207778 [Punica granatum]|uniref:Uncharacterized protein LOC116207778 n=1 Tax=Punica granatum TaxID=22663 RepID=A0A6P8DWQ0_PUNGR|nr:uncharacterized protein LOC116207778 [Punica granatum]
MNSTGASNSNTPTPTPPNRESTASSSIPKGINRGKSDPTWAHCKEVQSASGRKGLLCLYCSKVISGGCINRFKQHLAGLKGNAEACRKVPDAVRFRMQEHLVGHIMEKKRKRDMLDEQNPYAPLFEHDEEIVEMTPLHSKAKGKGTVFLKSVDASDASKTGDMLYKLFREVVLFVGQENVVHFVTDNAANYVAAGRLLEQEFKTIFWSPCAAYYINLILSDIGKLDENALRAMVIFSEWTSSSTAKESKAKEFVKLLFVDSFWSECAAIVQISEPLIRVLRIVDSDEMPAMGFLLEAMYKAREEMLKRFNKRKKKIESYINILDARWDRQLHKNLHVAGYWLNPKYQYDLTEMEKNRGTVSGLLDVIERYSYGKPSLQTKLTSEMKIFKNAEGDFGRVSAVSDRIVMAPDEWWMWNYFKSRNYDPIDFEKFASYSTWVLEDEPSALSNEELRTFRQDLQMCIQENGNDDSLDLNLEDLDMDDGAEDNIDGGNVNDQVQDNPLFEVSEAPHDVAAEDNICGNYGGDWSAWNC